MTISTASSLRLGILPPPLHFYNSMDRKLELFVPRSPGEVRLYTCGPTIYDFIHIGNLRTFLFEDLLRRVLRYWGYHVDQVMNLTDVDDKTIRGALREKMSLREYTDRFAQAFFEDLESLRIEKVEHYPRATDYIDEMIAMVKELVAQGYAYEVEGSVYFAIDQFHDYGKLAQLSHDKESRLAHHRLLEDEYDKESLSDFVLWKAHEGERDGAIAWPSPWGLGRPGWHIECSAMARSLLGHQLDIHTGGIDNLFPHHENEIAQSQCCHGKPLARYWLHSQHLLVDGRKMAKSAGNFFTLRDLQERGIDPLAVRYLLLQSHYRHPMNFTLEGVEAASRTMQRLRDFSSRLHREEVVVGEPRDAETTRIVYQRFLAALADDLNLPEALGAIFEWITYAHRELDAHRWSEGDLQLGRVLLQEIDSFLHILEPKQVAVPDEVWLWVNQRVQAREHKQWREADELRERIEKAGYRVEDGPQGPIVKYQGV